MVRSSLMDGALLGSTEQPRIAEWNRWAVSDIRKWMMDITVFSLGVLASLTANAIFLFVGGKVFFWFLAFRIRRLRRFLGIGDSNRFVVYLSRLEIDPSCLQDLYGDTPGQTALGLNLGEFQETRALIHLLSRRPDFFSPTNFAGFVDVFFQVSRPDVDFLAAPSAEGEWEDLEPCATICLGSPRYNRATAIYLEDVKTDLNFERKDTDLGYDVGYLAKFTTQRDQRTVILAAGLGVNGTRAAIRHLVGQWATLASGRGDQNFRVTLVCPNEISDPSGFEKATVVQDDETEDVAWKRRNTRTVHRWAAARATVSPAAVDAAIAHSTDDSTTPPSN